MSIFGLWMGKNEEGGSLDTKVQEESYLKDKASTIRMCN